MGYSATAHGLGYLCPFGTRLLCYSVTPFSINRHFDFLPRTNTYISVILVLEKRDSGGNYMKDEFRGVCYIATVPWDQRHPFIWFTHWSLCDTPCLYRLAIGISCGYIYVVRSLVSIVFNWLITRFNWLNMLRNTMTGGYQSFVH